MTGLWQLYRELLAILPPQAKRVLVGYSVSLAALALLDGLALGLLALVMNPLLNGTSLTLPLIGEIEGAGLIVVIGVVCGLIVLKAAFSVSLLWYATRRFAGFELDLGSRLFDTYVAAPWVERLKRNSADLVRIADGSVAVAVSGFLLPASTLLGEVLSFVVVVVVLAVAQPLTAVITIVYLGSLAVLLFFVVSKRSREAGRVALRYGLRVVRLITEMVGALKEITLRNKAGAVAEVVRENRWHSTRARANSVFLAQIPRYVLESGIVGGFVLVGVVGWLTGGLAGATSAVALFAVAGFRMAPSLVRFQAVVSQVAVNSAHAQAVVDEIRRSERVTDDATDRDQQKLADAPGTLLFDNVSFRYSSDADDVVRGVDLAIPFGSSVAFVGESGAGKSTMIDLLLGLVEPTGGSISIDGIPLRSLTSSWRSRVAYVPQDVSLFDSTVAQNVALSWSDDVDRDRVRTALAQAQLLETIEGRPGGIDAMVGERGLALSGGQRQRLGIARALYVQPLVLVLDEATSALDTATEAAIVDALRELRGDLTIISVAHRLATIRDADRIHFMSAGRVTESGTFSELVRSVPEFAAQARLAGLDDTPAD